jgi:hypothetical protein
MNEFAQNVGHARVAKTKVGVSVRMYQVEGGNEVASPNHLPENRKNFVMMANKLPSKRVPHTEPTPLEEISDLLRGPRLKCWVRRMPVEAFRDCFRAVKSPIRLEQVKVQVQYSAH